MSKDQKNTISIDMETVDKILEMLNWITTTITFWKFENTWPVNLIQDTVDELIYILSQIENPIDKAN